jgi:hypothetical protein
MSRILIGLLTLAAVIEGLAPGAVPSNLLPLAIVILGLVYGWTEVDAEDPVTYLAVAIAVGVATAMPAVSGMGDGNGVLNLIPAVGGYLDAIADLASTGLYAGVISILVARAVNRLKG